jgi:hypothetical protein
MQHVPYRESLRTTLLRTSVIAIVVGGVWTWRIGRWAQWPYATLTMMWPSLGGHFVELGFLNFLQPHLPMRRIVLVGVRFAIWFGGGVVLGACVRWTAAFLGGFPPMGWLAWWLGGVAFIAIELTVHVILHLRGQPCFFDGRG